MVDKQFLGDRVSELEDKIGLATTTNAGIVTLADSITSGDTTHVPTADAVYQAVQGAGGLQKYDVYSLFGTNITKVSVYMDDTSVTQYCSIISSSYDTYNGYLLTLPESISAGAHTIKIGIDTHSSDYNILNKFNKANNPIVNAYNEFFYSNVDSYKNLCFASRLQHNNNDHDMYIHTGFYCPFNIGSTDYARLIFNCYVIA